MSTLKDLILNADDLPGEVVHIDEWGVDVLIQAMDGESRARFAMSGTNADGERDETAYVQSSARVAVLVLRDPQTKEPIFTDADVPSLAKKSAKALDQVTKVAFRLSGFTEEEKKVVDEQFR